MKYVYTEKKNKIAKPRISTENYESAATRAINKKKRSEVITLIAEINRRTEENYHLG